MKLYWTRCFLADRISCVALILLLLARAMQFVSLETDSFEVTGSGVLAQYYAINNVALGVFVFMPLFVFFSLPTIRMFDNVCYCSRFNSRESSVYYFIVLVMAKATIFAFIINATAVLTMWFKRPAMGEVLCIAFSTAVMEIVLFLVCALLLLAVLFLTGKIQVAAIVLACYIIWDFAVDYIPFYASTLPRIGWRLTEIGLPSNLLDAFLQVLPLLTPATILAFISLVVFRRKDMVQADEEKNNA